MRSAVLAVPGWPGHLAGQHVDVRPTAEDGYQAQRSYSIASAPEEGERVTLTVERIDDGEVSPYLVDDVPRRQDRAAPADRWLLCLGHRTGGPMLLVGGGSGVCPLMAMIRHRNVTRSTVPTRLLYSSRSLADVIYHDELDRLAAEGNGLEVVHTPRVAPDTWYGYRRRIDPEMLQDVGWTRAEKPLVFVCGPTPLVEAVAGALTDLGHGAGRIKTERFGPTGG